MSAASLAGQRPRRSVSGLRMVPTGDDGRLHRLERDLETLVAAGPAAVAAVLRAVAPDHDPQVVALVVGVQAAAIRKGVPA